MLFDPIADLLTRIRNALKQRHRYVDVPLSKEKHNIAKLLHLQGFVQDVVVNEEKRAIRVFLKYGANRTPVVNGLKRISKPGMRRYIKHNEIPKVLSGLGIAVLSTNQGILDGESAKQKKVGGELLCYVW